MARPPGRPQGRQGRRRRAHARGSATAAQHGLCSRHRPAGRGRDLRAGAWMDNALRDVYLNGTPVANADGTLNFSGAAIDFRTGTQLQEPLPGFPAAESTIAVGGAEGRAALDAAVRQPAGLGHPRHAGRGRPEQGQHRERRHQRLSRRVRHRPERGWRRLPGSAGQRVRRQDHAALHAFARIELPRARQGWSIRLRRITPNANSNTIADRTFIDSVTEVIDAKLRYPMSAVVGIKINASQFQSIPTRAYHVRGRIIRVPAN